MGFLDRPRIYHNEWFFYRYESQARRQSAPRTGSIAARPGYVRPTRRTHRQTPTTTRQTAPTRCMGRLQPLSRTAAEQARRAAIQNQNRSGALRRAPSRGCYRRRTPAATAATTAPPPPQPALCPMAGCTGPAFTQPGGQPAPHHVSGGQRHDQTGDPLLPHHAPPPRAKVIR